jgi:hypothetical protein
MGVNGLERFSEGKEWVVAVFEQQKTAAPKDRMLENLGRDRDLMTRTEREEMPAGSRRHPQSLLRKILIRRHLNCRVGLYWRQR